MPEHGTCIPSLALHTKEVMMFLHKLLHFLTAEWDQIPAEKLGERNHKILIRPRWRCGICGKVKKGKVKEV